MSCLVVDDDPVTGSAVMNLLRRDGWEAEWAVNLDCARTKLRVMKPDVVVLDLELGNEVGLDLFRGGDLTGVHVILFTAKPDAAVEEALRTHPNLTALTKPADPVEIVKMVALGRK